MDLSLLFKIKKGDLKMEDMYIPKKVDIDRDFTELIGAPNWMVKGYHLLLKI